jgi:hypothetical protein
MPIQINEENGKICRVHVSGELVSADYKHCISEFERLVKQHGKLRVLFDMTDFRGWDAGALWQEVKFDMKHFKDIERCAAVGDRHWQQWLTDFCVPFTKATIRYFDSADAAAARKWLGDS